MAPGCLLVLTSTHNFPLPLEHETLPHTLPSGYRPGWVSPGSPQLFWPCSLPLLALAPVPPGGPMLSLAEGGAPNPCGGSRPCIPQPGSNPSPLHALGPGHGPCLSPLEWPGLCSCGQRHLVVSVWLSLLPLKTVQCSLIHAWDHVLYAKSLAWS